MGAGDLLKEPNKLRRNAKSFYTSINILTFALSVEVSWYRRYEIHYSSPRQVQVFLVDLTQI